MLQVSIKQVIGFAITVILSITMLTILSGLFNQSIQTLVSDTFIKNTTWQKNSTSNDWIEDWQASNSIERRSLFIDLKENIATFDFLLVVNGDYSHILDAINSNNPIDPIDRESLIGQLIVDNRFMDEEDFQPAFLDVDSNTGLVTIHLLAFRQIDNDVKIALYRMEDSALQPLNDDITVTYDDRKLTDIYPFPTETSEGEFNWNTLYTPNRLFIVEAQLLDTVPTAVSEIFSRQNLLQKVGTLLGIPFVGPLLSSILLVLPLLMFLRKSWQWPGKRSRSLYLVTEVVTILLTFHFVFYVVNALGSIQLPYSAHNVIEWVQGLSIEFYEFFGLYPEAVYIPWDILEVWNIGTVLVGILLSALLIRRSQEWDGLQFGQSLTNPFDMGKRASTSKKFFSFSTAFVFSIIGLLVVFLLLFLISYYGVNDLRFFLVFSLQIGILGTLWILVFRYLYIKLDGKPLAPTVISLAFLVMIIGNLIWAWILNQSDNIRDWINNGWLWMIFATILGALLVYAFMRVVHSLLRHMGLIRKLDKVSQYWMILISILVAIPMRLLFSDSLSPANYYEVLNLAVQLDALIKFIFLSGLAWFFYEQGKRDVMVKPLTYAIGLIAAATVLYRTNAWFGIPLTFIIGWYFLTYYIRPPKYWDELKVVYTRVFKDRDSFLEKIVNLNTYKRAYKELRKTLSEKIGKGDITYIDFDKQLDTRREELNKFNVDNTLNGKPLKDVALAFGYKKTAWANGLHGAKWAALFAIPWMGIWFFNFMSVNLSETPYPLWSFFTGLLGLVPNWVGIGFLFGYFFPFLRGNNGLQKGILLWVVIVLPALPLAFINNSSSADWQGFLFWVLQVFIHCMLLGLIAFDFMTMQQGYRDWRRLFELHSLPFVGVSISSILLAIGTTITALFQSQIQQIITAALTFILPNIPVISPQ